MDESSNLCIFVGGQTFSGKEECMFGDRLKGSLIYYTLDTIFTYIEKDNDREFVVRVSCFEIYNESIDDLLSINTTNSKNKVANADKVIEEVCTTYNEVIALWNMSLNNKINLNSNRKKEFYQNKKKNQLHMRKEPKEFAHTIFRVIIEAHSKNAIISGEKEQGEKDQSFTVSSIVFACLAGIEGDIHIDSLINKSLIEQNKLKKSDSERQDELAKKDETKSLAYLYKIFEELSSINSKCIDEDQDILDDVFDTSALTKFLKFYLKNGNCKIIFISCILTLEPFSCFTHDSLDNASLIENLFTRLEHNSLKNTSHFKSKCLELKEQIENCKSELNKLLNPEVKQSKFGYQSNIQTKKIDLADKIAKLQQKILTSDWVKILNAKYKNSRLNYDESCLISMNESDISRGAFDIDDNFLQYEMKSKPRRDSRLNKIVPNEYFESKGINDKLQILENMEQPEDKMDANFIDDPYLEGDSLSFLDQDNTNKRSDLDRRLSLIMKDSGYLNKYEK